MRSRLDLDAVPHASARPRAPGEGAVAVADEAGGSDRSFGSALPWLTHEEVVLYLIDANGGPNHPNVANYDAVRQASDPNLGCAALALLIALGIRRRRG
jgi:hypothetical protein